MKYNYVKIYNAEDIEKHVMKSGFLYKYLYKKIDKKYNKIN
jgi:hypothetical protein